MSEFEPIDDSFVGRRVRLDYADGSGDSVFGIVDAVKSYGLGEVHIIWEDGLFSEPWEGWLVTDPVLTFLDEAEK